MSWRLKITSISNMSGRPLRTAEQPPGRDDARPTNERIFVGGDRVQPITAGRFGYPCFHADGLNEPVSGPGPRRVTSEGVRWLALHASGGVGAFGGAS